MENNLIQEYQQQCVRLYGSAKTIEKIEDHYIIKDDLFADRYTSLTAKQFQESLERLRKLSKG